MNIAVVISDMHVGSRWGLLPRKCFNSETNVFQRWIIECWEDVVKNLKGSVSHILLNGDLTDGTAEKSLGTDAISTDLDDQVNWACELLQPLINDKTKVYGVDGSGYHSGKSTNTDRRVVEHFKGRYSRNTLHLEINNKIIQLSHASAAGNLKREIVNTNDCAHKMGIPHPGLILRGHVHKYIRLEDAYTTAISGPCWQHPTPFIEKRNANAVWDIGLLILEFDSDIVKVYPKIYRIPPDVVKGMRGWTPVMVDKKGMGTKSSKKWIEMNKDRKW